MSLFKEKRILLLVFVALLAVGIIYKAGITTGIDLAGGSRLTLKLEASQATIQIATPIVGDNLAPADEIAGLIRDNLLTSVKIVSLNNTTNTAVFEIGRSVSSDLIASIIDNKGQVTSVQDGVISDQTRDEVTTLLQTRVDPDGLKGVQSRPTGTNLVSFEIPAITNPEEAKALFEQSGRLEAFIENTLVLVADDIEQVGDIKITQDNGVYTYAVPLSISPAGADKFAAASQGKGNYPFVIYLDRPNDAILLFNNQLSMSTGITYDNVTSTFHISTSGAQNYGYNLLVSSIPIPKENIDNATLQVIQNLSFTKSRAIFVGAATDFSENVENSIKAIFTENNVKYFTKESETESVETWIQRACGLKSAPAISPNIAGVAARNVEITGSRPTYESAVSEANDLKTVLSQRLPVEVSIIGESSIPARLGEEFAFQIKETALLAVAVVGTLIFIRYRRLPIVGAIMMTMGAELLITLSIASAIRQTIGLPEIGGLLAVIGTGVEQQIIITDMVLSGEIEKIRPGGMKGRVGRAFSIILVAAATVIAAMVMLFFVGYGSLKGFAIVTISGVLIAITITRPAYSRVVSAIVFRETTKAEKTQVKAAQQ